MSVDQPVYVRDVDVWFPADPENRESEDEDFLHALNLNSEFVNDHAVCWIMDLPRRPVEFVNVFQSNVDASRLVWHMVDANVDISRPVWCMANANFDAHSAERCCDFRGQCMDQRESNKFLLRAMCKRKTAFKHDGMAIKPVQCIIEANPDVYKTERRRDLHGEELKQQESIKFVLCSLCMHKTVYGKRQAAKDDARPYSGRRRADERAEMHRGQVIKAMYL
ncbi:hypothetical protein FIBSPDRAFT_886292 [Athelia psychrophila]|uniref:Uncharacterized protein n=1 Tax=Athelia psychrophila TaxID=1759441 RepID=A0A166QZH0_9AGAM|nr:hypothetical protein FIBSPDRAFT_886292 [Fibularhizoctonia sp. CBS 109695]